MLAAWPGKIPAGKVCAELCGTIDILPTFAKIAGAELNPDRVIDGRDIRPLLFAEAGAKSPHESYLYYWGYGLDAVRHGPWKLHFPHKFPSLTGKPGSNGVPGGITPGSIGNALYNLHDDPAESENVLEKHPDIVAKIEKLADAAREDLGDSHRQMTGKNRRPAGRVE
jgi:arylsulfatase A-like enzyme